ncbi:UNVERIFIED_CONTAM: 1-aminocyclopropane-1-carboxylate oxidase, partial [Sesamum latifolium]
MGIPVVGFSKIYGKERADTLALIDRYYQEWGFFQEASFKNSKPVQLLNELVEKNSDEKIENVDWEDVFYSQMKIMRSGRQRPLVS